MAPRNRDLIKFLTPDELTRLIGSITNKRDRAIFLTAYRHGLRAGEIGLLQVSDLDLKRLRIMLHRTKNSLSGEPGCSWSWPTRWLDENAEREQVNLPGRTASTKLERRSYAQIGNAVPEERHPVRNRMPREKLSTLRKSTNR